MPKPLVRFDQGDLQVEAVSQHGELENKSGAAELPRSGGGFPIVGVGASAGGLEAFTKLLSHLALDTGMGFVLVQHLDPVHESALTQLLARATALPVQDVTNHMLVEPNHVYVIPPNTDLSIEAGVLMLQPRDMARIPARSIDFFFESLAADQHERAIGVILSGTASDGTIGLEAIKAEGGITFAQDDSAKYDSMPRSAVAAGCVDFELSPAGIADELRRLAIHPYVAGAALRPAQSPPEADHADATAHPDNASALPSGGSGEPDNGAERARAQAEQAPGATPSDNDPNFMRVLSLLRNHCGVDFTFYKSSTIQRRIARRMMLCRQDTLAGYAEHLRGNTSELDTLFSDVLIGVTSFFRNPDAFEVLQHEILPRLLAQRDADPLRVWVLGCSTGQEAYSIAMSFVETAERLPQGRKLQVFATDLSESSLAKARRGLYAKTLVADLSPERLRRFFVAEGGGYRVAKSLREMVVFARQNIISDPPLSRMDIITCRNLLIYLEPSLQKRIFPLFHYALKPHGFLWLGASESIGAFTDLFEPLDRKQKLYQKKAASTSLLLLPAAAPSGVRDASSQPRSAVAASSAVIRPLGAGSADDHSAQREADRFIANQYAPPGVLINADRQVLQFRGVTSAYLELPSGAATLDVLKMARKGLMLPLRSAIDEAARENKPVRRSDVRIEQDRTIRKASLQVIPLKNQREPCFLVLFDDTDQSLPGEAEPARRDVAEQAATVDVASADKGRIAELESDLAETREYLRSIQEVHEAANEKYQSANEEVQSANEELQSLNEELTTSKEELESSNEELTTLNDEVTHRNAELSVLGNDLINVQNSARLVMVLLGRDLTVRRFSAQAAKQFNLVVGDIGRPIGHVRHRLAVSDLEALITEVIDSVRSQERELQDKAGRWFTLHVRPYVTLDNRVDGAVLVLFDIDTLKRSEQALAVSEGQYRAMFAATSVGVSEADPASGRLLRVNVCMAKMLGYTAAELVDKTFVELTHADDRQSNWDGFDRLVQGQVASYEPEHRMLRKDGSAFWVHATVNIVRDDGGRALRAVTITQDIDERRRVQQSAAHLAAIVTSSDDAIVTTDLDGTIQTWNAGAERLFGYTVAEVVGKAASPATPAEQGKEEADILACIRRGEGKSYDTVRQCKDGSRIDVSVTVSPIRDGAGRVVGASKILRNITERRRIERALRDNERRFREMVDALPTAVYTTDLDGCLTHFNPATSALAGRTPLLGTADWCSSWKVYDADGTPIAPARSPLVNALRDNHAVGGVEAVLERPDGTRAWFRSYPTALHDAQGRLVGGISMLLDITESRQAEAALRDADRRKDEFLAMLAHELRNPLAPIRNALQMLRVSPGLTLDPGGIAESALQVMERQVAQMVRLVDDLLDVGRVSLGKIDLRLEHVDLDALMHQVEQAARPAFEARGSALALSLPEQPVLLNGDPARLVQIFGNLVNNACKFTPPGGRVQLSAVLDGAATVVIRVRDNGIGIAADDLSRVFQLFTQINSSLGCGADGLGIGLALVKDLTVLHGGTVAAHSEGVGRGSEFEVRLPIVVQAVEAPAAPAVVEPSAGYGRRILVVDDNRDAAESLAYLLQFHGYETELAYDGLAAVEAAKTFQPSVILLDLGLPKLNGYEATRRIREQGAAKRPVIVALTGWGQKEDRRRTTEAGFDAHLVKPVSFDALLKLLG